jgi:hypothetical protein
MTWPLLLLVLQPDKGTVILGALHTRVGTEKL